MEQFPLLLLSSLFAGFQHDGDQAPTGASRGAPTVGVCPDGAHVIGKLEGLAAQNAALKTLQALPVGDAIGAACSFLLHCSYNHRDMLRRVMNERVIRDGFRGVSLLEQFKRVSK